MLLDKTVNTQPDKKFSSFNKPKYLISRAQEPIIGKVGSHIWDNIKSHYFHGEEITVNKKWTIVTKLLINWHGLYKIRKPINMTDSTAKLRTLQSQIPIPTLHQQQRDGNMESVQIIFRMTCMLQSYSRHWTLNHNVELHSLYEVLRCISTLKSLLSSNYTCI
jgi:hypothetical protein